MAVIRTHKTKDYTVMSNYHLRDKNMSLKAKGLLSVILALPDDWDYSIAGLVAICKESETSVKTALNELKEFGYLRITKKMPNETENGRIEYIYDIFEFPIQEHEKQGVENLGVEFLGVENIGQLNTNKLNIKELNTNNKKIYIEPAKRFRKPTIEEIRVYCDERNNGIDAERFYDYYESKGWKVGKAPMKDWKASVRTWERNNGITKGNIKQTSGFDYDQFTEEY